ncbi:MAG: hypothetical protein QOK39_1611 [Acidimicrobiaceae bacterium]|nr:hypothetical protein [Acidimicrobiaceae bacterium]
MKIARTLGVVIVLALGAAACGSGTTQARTVALRPVSPASAGVAATSQPSDTTAVATAQISAPAATAAPHSAVPGIGQSTPKSGTAPPAVSSPATSAPSATVTTKASVPPVTASALAARRQPTSAEIAQVIASVKTALPFVTLTAAQIAQAGNQVCSAFDQGKTFAQVTTQVLATLGGAALGGLIPASVPAGAVRTLVTMFCPGYTSKLA